MKRSHSEGETSKKRRKNSESSSISEDEIKLKKKDKKKKRRHSVSSGSDSSSECRKKKHKQKKSKKHKKEKKKNKDKKNKNSEAIVGPEIPEELLQKSKSMAPMTKEEWEKQQSVVRKVYDEETGRHRLIKGTGEVLEEIVSKDMHKQINKQATIGDGNYFQSKLSTQHM